MNKQSLFYAYAHERKCEKVINKTPIVVSESDIRRSRALTWILLTIVFLVLCSMVIVWLFDDNDIARRTIYISLLSGLLALILLALALNIHGKYTTASWLTVTAAMFGTWGSIVLDKRILLGDVVPMVYIALSIILCSLLLSVRVTAIIALVQFIALALVPVLYPQTTVINWPSLLAFIFFTSLLGMVTNIIHRKDLEQIELQTRLLRESESHLRELSIRDPLTGLFNRRYMEETLERELSRAHRLESSLGVIMLDVDHFKIFNDTYGHSAGDVLLCELSNSLQKYIRGGDILCRYGGEEFVLILPGVNLDVLCKRAETLRAQAKNLRIFYDGRQLSSIAISLGVAIFPAHAINRDELLRAADIALYRAKHEGRDRVVVFDEKADSSTAEVRLSSAV